MSFCFFREDLIPHLMAVIWYFLISSGARMEAAGSHESCAGEYPFQRILYWSVFLVPVRLDPMTSSTSYSGSPSMMSGGGLVKFFPRSSVST